MQSLQDYIAEHYGTKAAFARAVGVYPQDVTKWVNKDFVVHNHVLYSPRRSLK